MFARDRRKKYNWDKWFMRPKFILVRGRDFQCTSHSMNVMVRNAARLRGVKISIRFVDDLKLVVTVLTPLMRI